MVSNFEYKTVNGWTEGAEGYPWIKSLEGLEALVEGLEDLVKWNNIIGEGDIVLYSGRECEALAVSEGYLWLQFTNGPLTVREQYADLIVRFRYGGKGYEGGLKSILEILPRAVVGSTVDVRGATIENIIGDDYFLKAKRSDIV